MSRDLSYLNVHSVFHTFGQVFGNGYPFELVCWRDIASKKVFRLETTGNSRESFQKVRLNAYLQLMQLSFDILQSIFQLRFANIVDRNSVSSTSEEHGP